MCITKVILTYTTINVFSGNESIKDVWLKRSNICMLKCILKK